MTDKDSAIMDLGRAMLSDPAYAGEDWDGLSLVATPGPAGFEMAGYLYHGDDFTAEIPEDDEAVDDALAALLAATEAEGGKPWKQALIHITRPDLDINVQFEYDDPGRWTMKDASLDMSDYAGSLRPQA